MVICPKCNFDNELGRMFCHQCGARLDLSQVKPPTGKRKAEGPGVGKLVWWIVRLVVLIGLVATVVLILMVPTWKTINTSAVDTRGLNMKLMRLEAAVLQKKPFSVAFSEAELNSHLHTRSFKAEDKKWFSVDPTDARVELGQGVVNVLVMKQVKCGSSFRKRISLSLVGVPVVEGQHFKIMPVAASIGRLPIHPWLLGRTTYVQNSFVEVFKSLKFAEEQNLLDRLTTIKVTPEQVQLDYQPSGGSK